MKTRFILVWPLLVPTSSPQATHLRFSTISVNPLQTLNTPWDPSPLCSKILQETTRLLITILTIQEKTSLLITTDFLIWTERFLSFRVNDTNWSSLRNFFVLEMIIQFEVPEWILNRFTSVCLRVIEKTFDN